MTVQAHDGDKEFNIVRRDLYPIDQLDGAAEQALVTSRRALIETQGYCILPDFVTPEALEEMAALSRQVARAAYVSKIKTNIYFGTDDETLPAEHPKRIFMDRTSSFVPADRIPAGSVLRRLYDWPPFAAG